MRRDPILDRVFGLYAVAMKTVVVMAFQEGLGNLYVLGMLVSVAVMGLAFTVAQRILRRE